MDNQNETPAEYDFLEYEEDGLLVAVFIREKGKPLVIPEGSIKNKEGRTIDIIAGTF